MLEDGAYRRLLDLYYASERPLPLNLDGLYRLLRAKSKGEREAVDTVIEEFFQRTEDGWRNRRADEEIQKAKAKADVARTNGRKGGRPVTHEKPAGNPVDNPAGTYAKAPNSQEPEAKSQKIKDEVGLAPDGAPVARNGHDLVQARELRKQAIEVLNFLNEKAERNYQAQPANIDIIVARLKEGATPDDCRGVIAKKCREWKADPEMNLYLRPATLFNRTKFANYIGELAPAAGLIP